MNSLKAIVLLSGGLDSTTVLAIARAQGYACYCLSFEYGQRQSMELEKARANAAIFSASDHMVLKIDLDRIGGSALTTSMAVPKGRDFAEMKKGIPVTYVPGRNTIFLSYAMAWAEVVGAGDIFIGVNALDYSGYPDCRPEFLKTFEKLAGLATRSGTQQGKKITIHAPLMQLSKREIIEKGVSLGVDYSQTHSCYDPQAIEGVRLACGECDACLLRLKGFADAGLVDPLSYCRPVYDAGGGDS